MRPVLRKNLLFFTSSSSLQSRAFFVRFHFSEFSSSPAPYPQWKRRDDESRNVRVSVWWDFENCNVPAGVNVSKVAPAITDAVRANGIKGPVHITAFGDVLQLSRSNQEALAFTGIHLTHVPNGGKNSADRSLLIDLMYWVSQNPPPAHLFLISGDKDFAGILHRLRMNNYNILLAIPEKAPDVLQSAATIMWQWSSLLKGEDLSGKHFNHPPDGQFGSWYGNYEVRLENPFSAAEHSTASQNVELSVIPKSVIRQVRHILSSHPNGIPISELRAELTKCDVTLDKSLYGYKKLSRFLLSIPHVHLQPLGEGKFSVRLIPSKSPKPSESITAPSMASAVKNEERGCTTTPNPLLNEGKNMEEPPEPSMFSLHERTIEDDSKSFQSIPSQGEPIEEYVSCKSSLGSEKVVDVANAQLFESQLSPKDNDVSKTEIRSFKMSSKKLSDDDIVKSEDVSPKVLEKYTTSDTPSAGIDLNMVENNDVVNCESGKSIAKDKNENQSMKEVDEVCDSPFSSAANDSLVEKRPDGHAENYSKRPTFLSWIRSWWPFSKSNAKADDLTAHLNNVISNFEDSKLSKVDQTASHFEEPKPLEQHHDVSHSGKPELFSSGSFWNDMESFVFTPKGSLLISQSRSREDLAHKLQKYGSIALKSLTENDVIQLVELLIAEKKWLEETPSKAFPFRLTQSVQKSVLLGQTNGATNLRSLFLSKTSQSNAQKSFEHDVEKYCQSIQQTKVSGPVTETKYTEKSRNDILLDCEKLVSEIVRQHPEGYNIGCFRQQFKKRYGYTLDLKKLGYPKMANLIEIMPGVKLESNIMFPFAPAVSTSDSETYIPKTQATNASHEDFNSKNELSVTSPKEDYLESPWEELGPVSVKNPSQNDLESNSTQKAIKLDKPNHPDYEPIVSDYDSSESEEDSSCLTQPEEQRKPKYDEQDSSFLQALDSWHSSKEGENSVKKTENVDVLGNSLLDILNSSTDSKQNIVSRNNSGNNREKQRSHKYSFVANPAFPGKHKFIGGILDDIKKPDESKMQN